MNKLIIFSGISLIISCSFFGNKGSINDTRNSNVTIVDTSKRDMTMKINFNYFNTQVEVLFTETKNEVSAIQKKNLEGFISKQDSLVPEIMKKIFEFYKDYKSGWLMGGKMSDKELEKYLPTPSTAEGLKPFIKPAIIHIQSSKDCQIGTLGIEFDCEWDIKNGLGVLINDWKVVEASVDEISCF